MNSDSTRLRSHRFFPDERLTAEVLNESADAERERRWLHNRLLHGYGISFGLEVERGEGDTSVVVGPGHAIDFVGRDLVVDEALPPVQVPPVSTGTFDLVCEWSDATRETSVSSCGAAGETLRREIPRVHFVKSPSTESGVVLGTVTVKGCKLDALVFNARRPLVCVPVPYVDGGQYIPRPADWSVLMAGGSPVGLTITVNTESGNFFGNVSYSARVIGQRWKDPWVHVLCLDEFVIASGPKWFEMGVVILADQVVDIGNPTSGPPFFKPVSFLEFAQVEKVATTGVPDELQWTVAWMGVEGTR